jgi:hypothetical protein
MGEAKTLSFKKEDLGRDRFLERVCGDELRSRSGTRGDGDERSACCG